MRLIARSAQSGAFTQARDDWSEVREAWIAVALVLVKDARLDCNLPLFEQRLHALEPFVNVTILMSSIEFNRSAACGQPIRWTLIT